MYLKVWKVRRGILTERLRRPICQNRECTRPKRRLIALMEGAVVTSNDIQWRQLSSQSKRRVSHHHLRRMDLEPNTCICWTPAALPKYPPYLILLTVPCVPYPILVSATKPAIPGVHDRFSLFLIRLRTRTSEHELSVVTRHAAAFSLSAVCRLPHGVNSWQTEAPQPIRAPITHRACPILRLRLQTT